MTDYPRPPDAAITDEEIIWLFRCMLGRDPESPETIACIRTVCPTFDRAQRALVECDEFRVKWPSNIKHQYYIPERIPLEMKRSSKKMCLASIVKNEHAFLENMIRSCAPIIDFAVIIDTGSSDDTIAIARRVLSELGVPHLIDEVPFQDFAHARNATLDRVPADMDWALMLDADEELVSADYPRFAALLDEDEVDGWQLPRLNFFDLARRLPLNHYPDYQLRLLRNRRTDPIRFVNRVHERPYNLVAKDAPAMRCEDGIVGGPHIHHLGYIEITREKWEAKRDFYEMLQSGNGQHS